MLSSPLSRTIGDERGKTLGREDESIAEMADSCDRPKARGQGTNSDSAFSSENE